MSAAGQLLLPRLRPRTGPALRGAPLPVTATTLSILAHGALAAAVLLAAHVWATPPTKTYVVNLVPAVAAVGSPQGRPSLPPRAPEPAPRPAPRTASELPVREEPRTTTPAPAPEMPARSASLPDRALPPRPSTAPRAGEKELPPLASVTKPAPPAPSPTRTASRAEPAPPPAPAPLGRASGSAQGTGPMTLEASDFPFAWYLAAVQRKIVERWEGRAQPGRQPVIVFEIARDGRVSNVAVRTSSGNSYYDMVAMRAIADAAPFPMLPDEWPRANLVIGIGFNFSQDRG